MVKRIDDGKEEKMETAEVMVIGWDMIDACSDEIIMILNKYNLPYHIQVGILQDIQMYMYHEQVQ